MTLPMIATLLMLAVIMFCLVKGFTNPALVFAFVPIVTALILGYTPAQIEGFFKSGVNSIASSAALMVFAVILFGVIDYTGGIDWLVAKIIKLCGNSVFAVAAVTTILSIATQLDGSGASTAVATIPTMKPIYKEMKMPREALVMIEGMASGVFTLIPWAPGFIEAATFAQVDPYYLFKFMIPSIIAATVVLFLNCFVVAWRAKRSGAGMTDEEFEVVREKYLNKKVVYRKGGKVAALNGIYAVACMVIIILGWAKCTTLFIFATPLLLWINFREKKELFDFLKLQSGHCFNMVFMMFGVAMMLGVITGVGGLTALANLIAENLPAGIMTKIPFLLCCCGVPAMAVMGNSYRVIIVPAVITLVAAEGINAMAVCGPALLCSNMAVGLFMGNSSVFMACGFADVEFSDVFKYSFINMWLVSIVCAVIMVFMGVLPW